MITPKSMLGSKKSKNKSAVRGAAAESDRRSEHAEDGEERGG